MYLQPGKDTVLVPDIEQYPEGIVFVIDKPYRWTSADVIRKVKYHACRYFGKKNLKVGHAGTLDPLATGVLLVCIGKATKLAEDFHRHDKQYLAGVTFGATTPSYDLEKEIDATYPLDGVSEDALRAVLPQFLGEQDQVAPLFSAKSVDGVRVYEMARKLYKQGRMDEIADNDILRASRIRITALDLEEYTPVVRQAHQPLTVPEPVEGKAPRIHVASLEGYNLPTASIRVSCSKGTYIRALARDLGESLGSGAFLSSLRRTASGPFVIADALSVSDVCRLLTKD